MYCIQIKTRPQILAAVQGPTLNSKKLSELGCTFIPLSVKPRTAPWETESASVTLN